MRLDVAGATGVGVVAPGATDVAGALEQHEVFLALLAQLDAHAQARKACADDDDAVALDAFAPRRGVRGGRVEVLRFHGEVSPKMP